MPLEVQTALISAVVALFTAALGGFITWNQFQRERRKWLIDLKTAYSLELYKARLASYPEICVILGKLSAAASGPVTPDNVEKIAHAIHNWLYNTGGMCAEASTRSALLGLRDACIVWGVEGERPRNFYEWRNISLLLLRRDLDIRGLEESYDVKPTESILEVLKAEATRSHLI